MKAMGVYDQGSVTLSPGLLFNYMNSHTQCVHVWRRVCSLFACVCACVVCARGSVCLRSCACTFANIGLFPVCTGLFLARWYQMCCTFMQMCCTCMRHASRTQPLTCGDTFSLLLSLPVFLSPSLFLAHAFTVA